jgi:hypothetical protein
MLTPLRVVALWPRIEPLFTEACAGNEVGVLDITPSDIFKLAQSDQAVIFVGFDKGRPTTVLAIQFNTTNGHKGADIIAMAGRNLLKFKALFWQPILDWLRANGVEFVDAYAPPALARVYMSRFGFTRSCVMVRMPLVEVKNEQGH